MNSEPANQKLRIKQLAYIKVVVAVLVTNREQCGQTIPDDNPASVEYAEIRSERV